MINNKTVAVVVPAYNEETQIGNVIETMPDFVDRIVIVNDLSKDKTSDVVKNYIVKGGTTGSIPEFHYDNTDARGFGRANKVLQEKLDAEKKLYTPAEVVNQNPAFSQAWFNLAECSYKLEEFDLALTYLQNAEKYEKIIQKCKI